MENTIDQKVQEFIEENHPNYDGSTEIAEENDLFKEVEDSTLINSEYAEQVLEWMEYRIEIIKTAIESHKAELPMKKL